MHPDPDRPNPVAGGKEAPMRIHAPPRHRTGCAPPSDTSPMSTDYSETALYEAVRRLDNDTRRNVGRQMTHLCEAGAQDVSHDASASEAFTGAAEWWREFTR